MGHLGLDSPHPNLGRGSGKGKDAGPALGVANVHRRRDRPTGQWGRLSRPSATVKGIVASLIGD